ncbi:DMT family transporter [Pikeienuella piscinae]|uniref:DMT family transporter n=1 Tax=Pikeienuella piscinae TaxID=2748098 RepID=A0A7M3T5Y5_9RHOB|nr:DMT family transporter [Pikeienuella piscinae]QIE57416.1 DMT family transporter [Pikeienuella piscinae]
MNATPASLPGHAAMLLFAALVSVSFSLGARAAPHIDPAALSAARFLIAAIAIGAIAAPRMRLKHFRATWRYPLLGGLLGGYFVLMFEALKLTDPISTGAIFTLTPIMTAGFAWLLMRQVTTGRMAVSLALAGTGAIWVIFRGDIEAILGLELGRGEAIFVIGCSFHALYAPLGRMLHRGEPVLVYTFGGLIGGFLVTGLYGARALAETNWTTLPPVVWIALFYLALAATAVTLFLVLFATLRLPSAKVMAYGYLVPSFVILWEGLFAGVWVAAPVWLGVVATIGALLLLLKD